MEIEWLIKAIIEKKFRVTHHAQEEAEEDNLQLAKIIYTISQGEIIEDYPTDKPFPSCLLLGFTADDEPIHTVWAYDMESEWAILITVYHPDPQRWINWRQRRAKK
ncbi:MAG: DUF4258 domain-containing protein [Ardenticatenaceae bacterium]|nr:DUF4258 domain-containing protein [Ardenticatenaceae bacterium]